ncbi:cyclin-dependent protein kinase inhibitor SMR1 [Mangifera indica]|uniref:cyclin-dependent protein kinase inhibitor SMR1 n=1 Tax=Mangifera indica TaxID=29780 RepID=UPI001CF938ED|nr:cyclin-dependent protein kinase inhibitor SMR1 [Mangifera indica]
MSTDLEQILDLPRIRMSPVKQFSSSYSATEEKDNAFNCDEECRTPTSEQHKIPSTISCPPAPRKPKTRYVSCKRKLVELEFFEIRNREEVETFLKASFDLQEI